MITMDMKQYTQAFLEDARTQLQLLTSALPTLETDTAALADARRAFHSVKSTAATMGFPTLAAIAQKHELLLKNHIDAHSLPSLQDKEATQVALEQLEAELAKINI